MIRGSCHQVVDQGIGLSFLQSLPGNQALFANQLVQVLAVAAGFDCFHEQAFGRGEYAVVAQVAGGGARPDSKAFEEALTANQDFVGEKEGFGQVEPPVGGVIERALEQIESAVVPGDAWEGRDLAREAVDVFGGDGVALKWHGAGPDLLGTKRFAPFAERGRLEDAQVECELVKAGAQTGKGIDDEPVLFAGVGLGGGLEGV